MQTASRRKYVQVCRSVFARLTVNFHTLKANEMTTVEGETVQYSSDSSSEVEDDGSVVQKVLNLEAGSQSTSGKKGSWLRRLAAPPALSIQSGDIMRSPTGSKTSSPVAGSPTAAVRSSTTAIASSLSPGNQTAELELERANAGPLELELETTTTRPINNSSPSRRGCYGRVFPILRYLVKFVFYSPKIGWFHLPVASLGILLLNLVVTLMVVAVVVRSSLSPKINVSIKSFGIPDHPAQQHWDAFSAAESNNFANTSSPIDTYLQSLTQHDERKRRSTLRTRSTYPNCPPIPGMTQNIIHKNWEMDMVFRVPSPAAEKNANILTRERISHIHDVEESIYNSSGYGNVCRKSSTFHCYPLSSLLSWLYLRDEKTGNYVYNTTDGFTPNLQSSLRQISNLSVALWFTGGEASFSSDFSFVEAKLLRSQIRVALPLPCFSDEKDRYSDQKKLVTDYFVSLMPFFEKKSTR